MKQRISNQKLTILALMMAMAAVLKYVSINTGFFRISLFDTPLIIAGIIAGPIWGGIVGLGADLIYGLCFSSYSYSFIMMVSSVLWGVCGGLFFHKKVKLLPMFMVVFITSLATTTINSVQLYIYYGGGMWAGLPQRIGTMLIKWPITSCLAWLLYQRIAVSMVQSVQRNHLQREKMLIHSYKKRKLY